MADMNILTRSQLESKLKGAGLESMLSGEYLEKNVTKQFSAEEKQTYESAVKMAQNGVQHSIRNGLINLERQAHAQGYEVGYSFNEKTNEIDVILYDQQTQAEINKQNAKEFAQFKAEMPNFRLALGTDTRGTKHRMPATKGLAAHVDEVGAYFTTELEDVIEGVTDKISSVKKYKGQSGDEYRGRIKSAVKRGRESAVKSIVSTEAYSIIDDEKYYEELRHQQSAGRDLFLQTEVKTAGIIGEVAKKLDLTKTIREAHNLTNKQVAAYNRRIDTLLTKYQTTYQTLGKQAADNLLRNADIWPELQMNADQVEDALKRAEKYFGSFLLMRGQIGLSSDEALQRKTIQFAGQRDMALRPMAETNRHPSQAKNYLPRANRKVSRRTEMIVPSAMQDEMDYFNAPEKQLYRKALVADERDVYDAYVAAVDEAINEELKRLKKQKRNQGVDEVDLRKMAEERVRKTLPVIAPSILDDMGIISASAAQSLDSVRQVAKNITKDEYDRLNAEANERWKDMVESGQRLAVSPEEYMTRYIAQRATGRSNLRDVTIGFGQQGGIDISAIEDVAFGGQAKTLDVYENLRETKQVLPDKIVQLMAKHLGVQGNVDMIGHAKSVKAAEIPQYIQALLTTWGIENGLAPQQIQDQAVQMFGAAIVKGVTADGKVLLDNARDLWNNYNWADALDALVKAGIIHRVEGGYSLGKAGDKAFTLYDMSNMADVWESTKDVKTSYKESSGAFRDLRTLKALARTDEQRKAFESFETELKDLYDPTKGRGGADAEKARADIDKILNAKSGAIVQTYKTKTDEDRTKSVQRLKRQHYDPNKGPNKRKKKYLITIGPGSDYTIDTTALDRNIDYSKGEGMLTQGEYNKTIFGQIEQITNQIQAKVPDAEIRYQIDPGTDFGFAMSFGEDGKEEGATGRFIELPNIKTNYRIDESGEKLYSLPEYSKELNSLLGAMNIPNGGKIAGENAQAFVQSLFSAANYGKSTLNQAAYTKRVGGSAAVHVVGISNQEIEEMAKTDPKRAEELMSAVYMSRELARQMLSDKSRFVDDKDQYDSVKHDQALNEALKRAGFDSQKLEGLDIKQKINALLDAITEGDGKAVEGLSSILNRYPSINKHAAAFANAKIDPSMTGLEMKVGPAMMKFLNGDYDGDTINLILGLWGSGYSIEAAAEMVERQKKINAEVYRKLKDAEKSKGSKPMISDADATKDMASMSLSALATKFNKPYTGLFSNISTRIREGLNASGYDYDILKADSSDEDYVKVIQGELVGAVGQILEQDSISAKKVEQRIKKRRDALQRDLTDAEKAEEEQTVLTEFENLNKMLRDPSHSFSDIIDEMQKMELLSDDVTQISAVTTSIINSLTSELGDDRRKHIYKTLGLNEADIRAGKFNPETIKRAGASIEYATGMKIFGGEYGKGFATSREFTPHMKDDTYQLLKFVKSVDEANNVLKTMGELIDENGNRFSEYGEKVKGAMGTLKLEAGQEAAKTIIAGKENKAISALAVSYDGLASEVEGLKEIGASKGWNTVTGFASQLAPFGRMGTDAGYGNISSRLDRIFANQNDSDEFISMSQEERARRFGYGNDVESFEKERGTVLSSIYGTAAHSISQVLSEASQKYGKDIMDLNSLQEVGDYDLISKYLDAIEIQRKKMGILGFSDDEIQKQQFKTMYSGERNFESLLNLVGGEKGKRFINLGKPEQSIVGENALGEKLYGQIDATYISKYLDQSGAEKSIFNVVDYKNLSGEIKPENVIQVLTYIALLRQLKAEVQKMRSEGMSENDAIDEIIRKNTDASGKQRYSKEFIQSILSSNDFAGKLISTSKGVTTQYSIQDPGTALMSKILSGNLSSEDLKTLMSFVTKNVSTTSQLQATEEYKQKVGEETTVAEAQKKEEESAKKAEEDKKELKKQYIVLLREEESLLEKIDKLNHQIKETQSRGEDTTSLKKDLSIYRKARNAVRRRMKSSEFSVLRDEDGNIIDEDILSAQTTQEAKRKSKKSLLGVGDAEDALKAFERYATKRMKLEGEIYQAQLKANTTVGNEKKAWENVVALKQQSLDKTKETYNILEQQARKKVGDQRVDEITESVKEQGAILSAQRLAGNRGNRTIFDVIKSDIQRATMRITDFSLAAKVLNGARKTIQQVYQNTLKLNEAMTNLRIITGSSAEQAKNMMGAYGELAMQLGTTTQAVAQSAAEWLRQGYSVSETNELIKSSTYLSRLGFMDMSQSVTALTSVMKGFRIEATDSMDIVDKLTQLDARYATTAGDIATALSRTSAVAREAGLDLDQTAAALTTMIDVSQQDASSVGNAFRTILARYGNVKASAFTSLVGDSEDIDDANGSINDTEKVLNAIGIQVRSSAGDMRDFYDVMEELAEIYPTLDEVTRNAVATALGGTRQRNLLSIMLQNWDQVKESQEEAEKAQGTAAAKMAAYNESVEYSIEQLSTAWETFTQKVAADPIIKGAFDFLTGIIEHLDIITASIGSLIMSLESFKIPTNIRRLGAFFGIGKTDDTQIQKTFAFGPNRMTQKAVEYGQQMGNTAEERASSNVVAAADRLINSIDNNTVAQNRKTTPQASGGGAGSTAMHKTFGVEQGVLNGKNVYKTADGQWRYYNHRSVNAVDAANVQTAGQAAITSLPTGSNALARDWKLFRTGSTISTRSAKQDYQKALAFENQFIPGLAPDDVAANTKNAKARYDQLRALRSQELKTNWKQSAIRGAATGLTAGIISGVVAEGDVSDKVRAGLASGVTTGLLSAIPGIGAIIGPIFGPVLGGALDKYILKPLLKADEIARKKRVEEAKENLEVIKNISNSVTGLIDIRKKGDTSLWGADDWKQANEYVESINKARNANEGFENALNEAVKSIDGFSWTIEGLTKNQETLAKIEAARIKYEAEQTYAAGEQDRYDALKKIEEAQKTLSKSTNEEEKKKAEATIKANRAAIQEYTDELNKAYMKSAFYSSGVSTMSQAQKNTASLDRLVIEMARAAEEAAKGTTDEKFFEDDGTLKSDYRSKFVQQLREQGGYEAVLTSSEKSVADYNNAINLANDTLNELAGKNIASSVKDLKELVNTKDGAEKLGAALSKSGEELDKIIDQINNADESKVATIAHSLNMTVEEFNEANKDGAFDFFTTGMALENLDAFISRIDKLNSYLGELATNGQLSAESLEAVAKNYAFLMQGEDGSFGAGNILSNLAELYAKGSESTIAQSLAGKFQKEATTSETWWNAWTQSDIGKQFVKRDSKNTTFTSFASAMSSMNDEEKQSYIDYVASLYNTDLYEEVQKQLIEWQTKAYDTEISNLESIKESLDDVNKQREKELELIKAKEALENASKEKKRVYREGVGIVYVTDQEAVKAAQDKVDELERQRNKDNIQYQIDTLEQQKAILENIENNKQLENLTNFVEKIQTALDDPDGNLFSTIFKNDETKNEMRDIIADGIKQNAKEVKDQENKQATKDALDAYKAAGEDYDKFMESNESILADRNNPAYASTYAKWLEKANALTSARAAYNKASSMMAADDTSAIKDKWSNVVNDTYSEKMDMRSDALNTGFSRDDLDAALTGARFGSVAGPLGSIAGAGIGLGIESIKKNLVGANVYMSDESPKASGEEFSKHMVGKNRSKSDTYVVGHYEDGSWHWKSSRDDIETVTNSMNPYDILINDWANPFYEDRAVFMDAERNFRWVNADGGKIYSSHWANRLGVESTYATGTLSSSGGPSLINENGLESIITPQGTITSLPAKSGIIPADLTRNLWALGEVAPNLIARLGGSNLQTNNSSSATDNSINIDNLMATFNTDSGFDGQEFLESLKREVILTRNNH